jgi:thioredoxin 1
MGELQNSESTMMSITRENIVEKTAEGIVVVDAFAAWCGPCKLLMPVLEKLSTEHTIYKVDMENAEDRDYMRFNYNISSIPTLLFFKDGVVMKQTQGAIEEAEILEILESLK